jgi:hypothetical protein
VEADVTPFEALLALWLLGATLVLAYLVRLVRVVVAQLGLTASWQVQEAEQRRQRHAPEHKLSGPLRTELLGGAMGFAGHCTCGWESASLLDGSVVLDQMEAHRRQMAAV